MSQNILINCDMGECLNPDPDPIIMPLIDMAILPAEVMLAMTTRW